MLFAKLRPNPSELSLKSSNKCRYWIFYRLLSEKNLKTRFFILSNKCRTSNFRIRQLFDSNNCHSTNWGVIFFSKPSLKCKWLRVGPNAVFTIQSLKLFSLKFTCWNILSKTPFFQRYVIISWVVLQLTTIGLGQDLSLG